MGQKMKLKFQPSGEGVDQVLGELQSETASNAPALAYALGAESVLRQGVENLLSGALPRRLGVRWGTLVIVALILTAISLSSMHYVLDTVLGTFIK